MASDRRFASPITARRVGGLLPSTDAGRRATRFSVNDTEFIGDDLRELFRSPPELLPTSAMTGSSPQSFMMYDIAALQALLRR